MQSGSPDFGYSFLLLYWHSLVVIPAVAALLYGIKHKWSKVVLAIIGMVGAFFLAGILAVRFGVKPNDRMPLPTEKFMAGRGGRVLDIGAGSGRASLMVLEARPGTTVVALDAFAESYVEHFSTSGNNVVDVGRARLENNFKVTGMQSRASITAADMRQVPFPDASFDAAVSTYAIDHVNTQGVTKALSEVRRVLKPDGEFLLTVLNKDPWLMLAWGPILVRARMRDDARWQQLLAEAHFTVIENGAKPGTLWYYVKPK